MNLDESALDSGTFIYLNVAQKMFCSIDVGLPFVLLKFLTFSSFSVSLSLSNIFTSLSILLFKKKTNFTSSAEVQKREQQ